MSPEFDRDAFLAMLAADKGSPSSDGGYYLRSSLDYLRALLPFRADPAWVRIIGVELTAYVYSKADGEVLERALGGETRRHSDQRDGDYWLWHKRLAFVDPEAA